MNYTTKFKTLKSGLNTAAKYQEKPMQKEHMTVRARKLAHQKRHPNDNNTKKENTGVQWAKSRKTERDKKLAAFYKTHTYTWVTPTHKAWVSNLKEEEE